MLVGVVMIGIANAEHGGRLGLGMALSYSLAVLDVGIGDALALETHLL